MKNIIIIFVLIFCLFGCGCVSKSDIDLCEYYAKQNNKKLKQVRIDLNSAKCLCEDGTQKYVSIIKSEISQKVIENGINE